MRILTHNFTGSVAGQLGKSLVCVDDGAAWKIEVADGDGSRAIYRPELNSWIRASKDVKQNRHDVYPTRRVEARINDRILLRLEAGTCSFLVVSAG